VNQVFRVLYPVGEVAVAFWY